jgi:hypothetical protein
MRRFCLLSIPVLVSVCAGCCGPQGHWRLKEVQPLFGHEDFKLARASFYPNHTFEALAVMGGKTIKAKGMYEYKCCSDELTIYTGDQTFQYKIRRAKCGRLEIEKELEDGEIVKAVMIYDERCSRHPDDQSCCDSCCGCECE